MMEEVIQVNPIYSDWVSEYRGWQESNLTQAEWCKINGINVNTFRYRISRLRRLAADHHESCISKDTSPEFAAIPMELMSGSDNDTDTDTDLNRIVLEADGKTIMIPKDTDTERIRMIMEVFLHA